MYVIGTAGHVDHGKSALIRALTGIDPDRLQEEKDRGMTIDLGFAWLKLPGGEEVSIVDVPGHERFIKNMLAGVGGIDLALLVVAADEGVMPQTREHLAILDLLGVAQGVLVLTKSDLVESDWLDLVTADVEELASTTSLAGSPIVRCSVVTGDGLPELIEAISAKLAETTSKRDLGRPRLPIDRVFSIAGFGTVVTGTLIDGAFSVDQEVEILPAVVGGHLTSVRARIRGLQNHQSSVERSLPGTRTAANLAGVDRDQLRRGMVVTTPGWLQPSEAVDVRLRLLPGLTRTLRHNLNVSFHSYASEVPARVRLIEAKELLPGDEAWAQIRLLEPAALVNGDRFIIRDSNDTLGGGVIIETQARRHSRGESIATRLEARQSNNPAESLLAALPPTQPMEISALFARLDMSSEASVAALDQLVGEGSAVVLGQAEGRIVYAAPVFERLRQTALEAVQAYLSSHHLRRGIPREELRSRLNLPPRNFGLVIEALVARNDLVEVGAAVAAPDWRPTLSQSEQAAADAYLALLRATPLAPPLDKRPDEEIVAYLIDAGEVVEVGDSVVFDAAAYARMIAEITSFIREKGSATLAEVRDLLGTSRRYVAALLEHLDSRHITMRRGDERILRG